MSADHGLRPDDLQSVQHAGCQPIQRGKYQTVDAAEGQSLRRFTSQHVELMTKHQDLCLQRRSRPEQSDQRQPNQAANISHQPRASPNSTSLASRIEFPTVTGPNLICIKPSEPKSRDKCRRAPLLASRLLHGISVMNRHLLAILAICACQLLAAVVEARSSYDGQWNITFVTQRGDCNPTY